MLINKCPGQDKKNIGAEGLKCTGCGYEIEVFSDEIKIKCPKCGNISVKKVLPSCVDWCKAAAECVGQDTYTKHLKDKSILLKEKLLKELEQYFGADTKRINHAKKVLDFSEELLRKVGGDWHIVVPAAILHDVGIKIAEEKYGSNAGHLQEKEGPAVARKILLSLGINKTDIDEICEIIAHHHTPGKINSNNFKLLHDSDWLVNLKDEVDLKDKDKVKNIIDKVFFTAQAQEMARNIYL